MNVAANCRDPDVEFQASPPRLSRWCEDSGGGKDVVANRQFVVSGRPEAGNACYHQKR